LLAAFGLLPIRAILFIVEPGPIYILAVEVLDGLTAVVIGIPTPLVIAGVTRGSGRYNLAQGMAGTATGAGAAISTAASGVVAQSFGYTIGFLALTAMAGWGVALILLLLPETKPKEFGTTRWHHAE
jgi:sugar phosphate permease